MVNAIKKDLLLSSILFFLRLFPAGEEMLRLKKGG